MKIVLLILLVVTLIFAGCASTPKESVDSHVIHSTVEKVEIYHFHGNQQCSSCIAVGKFAEETVNTYFADELKSGKVVFAHVNAQLPENLELARKYDVSGSSLWIGVYDSQGFHPEQNTNVWYKISDKQDYMTYLKGIIDKRLAGDFN